MDLHDRINAAYTDAYKAKRAVEVATLRLIKAALQSKAIDLHTDKLEDSAVIAILKSQLKQRKETLDAAVTNKREDVAATTREEIAVIESYLPEPPSAEEIERLVDAAIQENGPNMGAVMKAVMAQTGGSVDGKQLSQIVNARLAQHRKA